MSTYSKIDITFTQDVLPLGAQCGFDVTVTPSIGSPFSYSFIETVVTSRTSANEMTLVTAGTGITGEQAAINYKAAIDIDMPSGFTITRSGNVVTVYIDNTVFNGYEFFVGGIFAPYTNHSSILFNVTNTASTVVVPVVLSPLVYHDLSITIIDTYVNTMPLVVQLTKKDSPTLKFTSGDDLFSQINKSELSFNMLDLSATDLHFFHLFTGDEQRYKVELNGIDTSGTSMLIWQGFLLPDQYKEPYQNGLVPVEFSATDMIGSLKGKYLKPWYYNNVFPIVKILTYLLAQTGLRQKIIVNPSILPAVSGINWDYITVNCAEYYDGKKYTDCYSILTKILEAQQLQITSFRGYWFLDGLTTRNETTVVAYLYDLGGDFQDMITYDREIKTPMFEQDVPMLTAETPIKTVVVDFNYKSTDSFYPTDIVKQDIRTLNASNGTGAPRGISRLAYWTNLFKYWVQNYGTSDFELVRDSAQFSLFQNINFFDNSNEGVSISNFIGCNITPFVEAGKIYDVEIDAELEFIQSSGDESDLRAFWDAGDMDHIILYQILVSGVEVMTNRPSVDTTNVNNFDTELQYFQSGTGNHRFANGGKNKILYKLKKELDFDITGNLEFRWCKPLVVQTTLNIHRFIFRINSFSIKPKQDRVYDEKVTAFRPVKYTLSKDFSLDLSCSKDRSISNSFGLNQPLDNNYIKTIVPPDTNQSVTGVYNIGRREITATEVDLLFRDLQLKKNVFVTTASGDEIWYKDVMTALISSVNYIAYVVSMYPISYLPPGYELLTQLTSGDTMQYIYVQYLNENYSNREKWKLKGGSVVDTYLKTFAAAIFNVQAVPLFRIEATALDLIFPTDLIDFYFDGADKIFMPTTLTLNLFEGKTTVVAIEDKFTTVTDISYE